MHDSKLIFKTYKTAFLILCQMGFFALFLLWLYQKSISLYYEQQYHNESPLVLLDRFSLWQFGNKITENFSRAKIAFLNDVTKKNTPQKIIRKPIQEKPIEISEIEPSSPPTFTENPEPHLTPTFFNSVSKITLSASDKVFFVGDSLMQGIAPHAKITLFKRFGISSLDLSRQSTGLTYTGLFNWVKAVTETLENDPDIRLMVVMFGPNDPWDFPVEKGKPFLRFKTEKWDIAYKERIATLLDLAHKKDVRVIWIDAPHMRNEKLSLGMAHLNMLYREEVIKKGDIFIHANTLLGYDDTTYKETMIVNEKEVKIRANDGIHFTPTAQRIFAEKVVSLIDAPIIPKKEKTDTVSQ